MQSKSKSLFWSSLDKFGVQVFALIVGVLTTRMLSPKDFNIIACLAIFTALSNVLVDSGFSAALIRREQNSSSEYSAAFIFNIALSIALYFLLWGFSGTLADFFGTPEINPLSRFIFLGIVINSLGIIPNVLLTRSMRFKDISIANLSAAVVSALLTIVLVLAGYTYWAIAWQQVSLTTVRVTMLWLLSRWQPKARPDFDIIRKIFSFSVFLLGTSILNIVVKYIYNLKIPIAFSKEDNGYYDRARKFQDIPSTVVTSTIVSVAYPILSELNGDKPKQLTFFRKIVRVTSFMIFPIMLGLIGIIDNVTTVVLTDKWASMIPYFRILCIAGIFLPFQSFCLTTLNALGKSNLNFTLELGRNLLTLALFVLFSGTISQMLWGFGFAMFASYTVNMIIVGKRLGYSVINHLKDILPYAVISVAMCVITILIGRIDIHIFAGYTLNTATILLLQTAVAIVFYSATTYLLGSKVIRDCIELVVRRKK